MDKLKALLEQFELDKYLGDLMTMGVFSIEDLCKLQEEDVIEIVGAKGHPDYLKLINLISTVSRRYKKFDSEDNSITDVIESFKEKKKPSLSELQVKTNMTDTIPGIVLLGVAIIMLGFVILIIGYNKEELYFDDLFIYLIGFIVASFSGTYLIKKELVSTPKYLVFDVLLVVVFFCFVFLLCEGCYWGRIDDFDIGHAGAGPTVLFFVSCAITIIYGIAVIYKPNKSISYDLKPIKAKSSDEKRALSNPDRIHWNTELNGYGFKYAWFISYIGMPFSVLLCLYNILIQLNSFYPNGLFVFLFGVSAALLLIAASGLYRFRQYAYKCLIANYIFGIALKSFSIILIMISGETYYLMNRIVSGCFNLFISIICWVYFYHRKDCFNK